MTSFLLSLGCTLIAFSPILTLLILFAYKKAQLIIIVTTSAFFYLLSSLVSSILNSPFLFLKLDKWNAFSIIPISVLSQSFFRCAFVKMYRRVEDVIEESTKSQDEEEKERRESRNGNDNRRSEGEGKEEEYDGDQKPAATTESESAMLRLELNDISCSIAAGVGFGGMHTVLLYGTLLASEGGRMGTLYQPSCAVMPSLVNSAIMAFWFSILDVVWMMITFYGVRVWESHVQYKSQQTHNYDAANHHQPSEAIMKEWSFGKGRVSGKAALFFMGFTHLIASLTTTFNVTIPANGCVIALPLLTIVAVGIVVYSWMLLRDSFLPQNQKQRIRQVNHLD